VFEHLRDRYLSPLDLLRVLKAFNMETALLVKRILNIRLDMLDASHSISTLEIKNLSNICEENEDYRAENELYNILTYRNYWNFIQDNLAQRISQRNKIS